MEMILILLTNTKRIPLANVITEETKQGDGL